jgi:hypothetical protein
MPIVVSLSITINLIVVTLVTMIIMKRYFRIPVAQQPMYENVVNQRDNEPVELVQPVPINNEEPVLLKSDHIDRIYREISSNDIELVYIAIGSAMNVDVIEDIKNQQYPPFVANFNKKVIILIDRSLEDNLAVQKYWAKMNDPLHIVYVDDHSQFRVLRNSSTTVFAVNDNFTSYYNSGTNRMINYEVDVSILQQIITICLNKRVQPKVILQDFSGIDSTALYVELCKKFNRDNLLHNVIFDITQSTHGECFPRLDNFVVSITTNLIQEKYLPLAMIKKSLQFKRFVDDRIKQLIYPIHLNYINLIQNSEQINIIDMNTVCMMFQIYSLEYNEHSTNRDYLIERFHCLLTEVLLTDLVAVIATLDEDHRKNILSDDIFQVYNNIENRDVFIRRLNAARTLISE